jgi:hypothetical protein
LLEGSTSDQEAIDVLYFDEFSAVIFSNTAAVDNPAVACLLIDIGEVISDPVVDFINLVSSGSFPSSNCPHWLIGKYNIRPVVPNYSLHCIQLPLNNLDRFVLFTLSQSLTKTENYL